MPAKILVADDDKTMLGLYSRIFSGMEYSISMAESFREALEMLRSADFDLLITDFMFPDGLGTDLIRAFAAEGKQGKSLLVSGSCSVEELKASGVKCYLEKPFKIENFLALVSEALG